MDADLRPGPSALVGLISWVTVVALFVEMALSFCEVTGRRREISG